MFGALIDYYRSRGGAIELSARCLAVILSAVGARYRLFRRQTVVQFPENAIRLPRLPQPFHGFRIAQVSDPHHSRYTKIEDLDRLVALVNRRQPDLVVLTGDYVSHHGRYAVPCLEALRQLQAPFGVFGILGNHDYYEGVRHTREAFQQARIPLLVNRSVPIENHGARIWLAGVDDPGLGDPNLDAALDGVPRGETVILLCHNPDWAETIPAGKVDLVLSGHTHGGLALFPVIGPLRVPSKYGRKYLSGLLQAPHTPVFVSRGVGAAVVPFRYHCPPEVPIHRLEPATGSPAV